MKRFWVGLIERLFAIEPDHVRQSLARCDQEIAGYSSEHQKPAWLVTLGVEDWEMEKRMIKNDPLLVGREWPHEATLLMEAK